MRSDIHISLALVLGIFLLVPPKGWTEDVSAKARRASAQERLAENIAGLDFVKVYTTKDGAGTCALFANTKGVSLFGCGTRAIKTNRGGLKFAKSVASQLDKKRGRTIVLSDDLKLSLLLDPHLLVDMVEASGRAQVGPVKTKALAQSEGGDSAVSAFSEVAASRAVVQQYGGFGKIFEKLYEQYLRQSKNLPKKVKPPSKEELELLIRKTEKEAKKAATAAESAPVRSKTPDQELGSGWALTDSADKVTDIRVDGPHPGGNPHGPGNWLPHAQLQLPDGSERFIVVSPRYKTTVMLTPEDYKKLREEVTDKMLAIQKEMNGIKDPKNPRLPILQKQLDELYDEMLKRIDQLVEREKKANPDNWNRPRSGNKSSNTKDKDDGIPPTPNQGGISNGIPVEATR
ncbi:MAG: hypothetical protein RL518_193 [Pseudomonadota bacterium]